MWDVPGMRDRLSKERRSWNMSRSRGRIRPRRNWFAAFCTGWAAASGWYCKKLPGRGYLLGLVIFRLDVQHLRHRFRESVPAVRPTDGASLGLRASSAMPGGLAQWRDRKPEVCQTEVPPGTNAGLEAADFGSAGEIPYRVAFQVWPVSIQLRPGTAMLVAHPPQMRTRQTAS